MEQYTNKTIVVCVCVYDNENRWKTMGQKNLYFHLEMINYLLYMLGQPFIL